VQTPIGKINNFSMDIIKKSKKYIYSNLTSYVLFFLFIINELFKGLIKGGRWDLNEQIALGDRLVNGTLKYSSGINDLFVTSSPYFPGVGILSAFLQLLGIDNFYVLNQVMIFVALLTGVAYYYILRMLTKMLFPQIPAKVILFMLLLFLITHFNMYKFYLNEFKPDTILLVISGLIFLLIFEKGIKNPYKFISSLVLLFFATFFKQSAFLVFFLALPLIIFNKNINKYQKILYSLSLLFIGFFAISIIFRIENCYLYTVEIMGQHSFFSIGSILVLLSDTFIGNPIFCCIFLVWLFRSSIKIISSNNPENKLIYLGFSIAWFCFYMFSMCKVGGNLGNSEVALIPFMPFIINEIYIQFQSVNINTFHKKLVKYILIPLSIYFLCMASLNVYMFIKNTANNIAAIEYLNHNFENKKALIDGNTYINAGTAGLNVISEVSTISHFSHANSNFIEPLVGVFGNQYYEILYLDNFKKLYKQYPNNIMDAIEKNYALLESSDLPKGLTGKLYLPIVTETNE